MNKISKLSIIVLMITLSNSFNSGLLAQNEKSTQEVTAKVMKMSMNIDGMTCAMGCARAIEVELNNIDGVEARVDFDTKNAVLSYNSELTSEVYLVDFVNNYRKGAFSASVISPNSPGKSVKSCCSSKKEACSAEQKAKCADKKDVSSESSDKSCCASKKLVEGKQCNSDCTKPCCA